MLVHFPYLNSKLSVKKRTTFFLPSFRVAVFCSLLGMACSLKSCLNFSGFLDDYESKGVSAIGSSFLGPRFRGSNSRACRISSYGFTEQPLTFSDLEALKISRPKSPIHFAVTARTPSICVSRSMRWWEKTLKPNMVEVQSAPQLVDYLLNAGDRLVIIDFYSPGCGGCKTLHPKICQLAEQNPNALILKVNHEELKTMCYGLRVHVLPFFTLYRGSEGRLCGFSCTTATVKKLKDALAKHGTERCGLGPAKGLGDDELLELASLGEIQFSPRRLSFSNEIAMGDFAALLNKQGQKEDNVLFNALTN